MPSLIKLSGSGAQRRHAIHRPRHDPVQRAFKSTYCDAITSTGDAQLGIGIIPVLQRVDTGITSIDIIIINYVIQLAQNYVFLFTLNAMR